MCSASHTGRLQNAFARYQLSFAAEVRILPPPQVQQLRRAASLPPVEQAGMVAAINFSIQSRLSFDTCWLENIGERIVVETVGNRITPLVLNPGRVLLTNERLYFQVVIVLIEI